MGGDSPDPDLPVVVLRKGQVQTIFAVTVDSVRTLLLEEEDMGDMGAFDLDHWQVMTHHHHQI